VNKVKAFFGEIGFVKNFVRDHPVGTRIIKLATRLVRWLVVAIIEEKIKRVTGMIMSVYLFVETIVKLVRAVVEEDSAGWMLLRAGQALLELLGHIALAAVPLPIAVMIHTCWNAKQDIVDFVDDLRARHGDLVFCDQPPIPPYVDLTPGKESYPGLVVTHNKVLVRGKEAIYKACAEFSESMEPPRGEGSLALFNTDALIQMSTTYSNPTAGLNMYRERVLKTPVEADSIEWYKQRLLLLDAIHPGERVVVAMTEEEQLEKNKKFTSSKRAIYDETVKVYFDEGVQGFTYKQMKPTWLLKEKESLVLRVRTGFMNKPRTSEAVATKQRTYAAGEPAQTVTLREFVDNLELEVNAAINEATWYITDKGLTTERPRMTVYTRVKFHVAKTKTKESLEESFRQTVSDGRALHIYNACDDTLLFWNSKGGKKQRLAATDLSGCDMSMRVDVHDATYDLMRMFLPNFENTIEQIEDFMKGHRKLKFETKGGDRMKLEWDAFNSAYKTHTASGSKLTVLLGQVGASIALLASLDLFGKMHGGRVFGKFEELMACTVRQHEALGLRLKVEPNPFGECHTASYLSMSIIQGSEDLLLIPSSYTKQMQAKRDPSLIFPGKSEEDARAAYFAAVSCNPSLEITPEGRALKELYIRHSGRYRRRAKEMWDKVYDSDTSYKYNPMHQKTMEPVPETSFVSSSDMSIWFCGLVETGLAPPTINCAYDAWLTFLETATIGDVVDNEYVSWARSRHYGEIVEGLDTNGIT
jgi:hypothetical protein